MAGKPQERPGIQERRASRADGGEPLYDPELSLYNNNGSVVVAIPPSARNIHGLEIGDKVTVEIYRDGIWIGSGGNDE